MMEITAHVKRNEEVYPTALCGCGSYTTRWVKHRKDILTDTTPCKLCKEIVNRDFLEEE